MPGQTVTRGRFGLITAAVTVAVVIVGLVVRNQVKVYRGRQARAVATQQRQPAVQQLPAGDSQRAAAVQQPLTPVEQREALFHMLQPVALANCQLERFGETHDGGYLMCGNLLQDVQSGYSYGIGGYDKWGCDLSTRFDVTIHQYDCFNTTQPACSGGNTVFHAECVGDKTETVDGRVFDTVKNQVAGNGDRAKRLVLKIDVEGAEWETFLSVPDEILERVDQMAVEFHWLRDDAQWVHDDRYLRVVRRLKQFFEIAHLHFNNASCDDHLKPFPTWAYEVLFVSKRLALVDRSRKAGGLHPLDAPNKPSIADCQPTAR